MNLCIGLFFYGLKGLVFFLADEQKAALCVSVISLPGLAAKLASAAPSVELAPRSQCHTERAAFQTTKNWLCLCEAVCVDAAFFFPKCMPKPTNMQHCPTV